MDRAGVGVGDDGRDGVGAVMSWSKPSPALLHHLDSSLRRRAPSPRCLRLCFPAVRHAQVSLRPRYAEKKSASCENDDALPMSCRAPQISAASSTAALHRCRRAHDRNLPACVVPTYTSLSPVRAFLSTPYVVLVAPIATRHVRPCSSYPPPRLRFIPSQNYL